MSYNKFDSDAKWFDYKWSEHVYNCGSSEKYLLYDHYRVNRAHSLSYQSSTVNNSIYLSLEYSNIVVNGKSGN